MTSVDHRRVRELLDRIELDLAAVRAMIGDDPDEIQVSEQPDDLLDSQTASERSNMPSDSLRWAAREKGVGQKVGGRWLFSARALQDYCLKREK